MLERIWEKNKKKENHYTFHKYLFEKGIWLHTFGAHQCGIFLPRNIIENVELLKFNLVY